jgi:hypothetical protein
LFSNGDPRRFCFSAFFLVGLRYSQEVARGLLRGLFHMKESVTYQAVVEEGRQEGLREGLREGKLEEARRFLLLVGEERLGPPMRRRSKRSMPLPSSRGSKNSAVGPCVPQAGTSCSNGPRPVAVTGATEVLLASADTPPAGCVSHTPDPAGAKRKQPGNVVAYFPVTVNSTGCAVARFAGV